MKCNAPVSGCATLRRVTPMFILAAKPSLASLPKKATRGVAPGDQLVDPRTVKSGQHEKTDFRQPVFGRLGGDEDINGAVRLGSDPPIRVGAVAKRAASGSQIGRFQSAFLASDENGDRWSSGDRRFTAGRGFATNAGVFW
jgi:hypothetical protein